MWIAGPYIGFVLRKKGCQTDLTWEERCNKKIGHFAKTKAKLSTKIADIGGKHPSVRKRKKHNAANKTILFYQASWQRSNYPQKDLENWLFEPFFRANRGIVGQKIKMPNTCEKQFCKNIRVVLCKKPLGKTANIREMRRFWKSAILQRLWPMPGL